MKNTFKHMGILGAAVTAALTINNAVASPSDYVFVPTVEYGEREVDFKAGTTKFDGLGRESVATVGFGYGVTQTWFTEAYLEIERDNGKNEIEAVEWENKFQLTEPGEYAVDVGFITEIEIPEHRENGYEFKFGPLFQKDFGKTQLNFNLLFERAYRAVEANPMVMGYQLQAKYRWTEQVEFGMQGFGEMGKWNDFSPRSEQSHRFGPAIFGKIDLGNRQAIKYNAAFLFDAGDAVDNRTFRMQAEYEF